MAQWEPGCQGSHRLTSAAHTVAVVNPATPRVCNGHARWMLTDLRVHNKPHRHLADAKLEAEANFGDQ